MFDIHSAPFGHPPSYCRSHFGGTTDSHIEFHKVVGMADSITRSAAAHGTRSNRDDAPTAFRTPHFRTPPPSSPTSRRRNTIIPANDVPPPSTEAAVMTARWVMGAVRLCRQAHNREAIFQRVAVDRVASRSVDADVDIRSERLGNPVYLIVVPGLGRDRTRVAFGKPGNRETPGPRAVGNLVAHASCECKECFHHLVPRLSVGRGLRHQTRRDRQADHQQGADPRHSLSCCLRGSNPVHVVLSLFRRLLSRRAGGACPAPFLGPYTAGCGLKDRVPMLNLTDLK